MPFSETYDDGYQTRGVNCLCGMPKWQMINASVEKQSLVVDDQSTACVAYLCVALIREPHTPIVNQKRKKDLREDMRFFLARSGVSGFTRPDEFDLCGCCCCEAPRLDRTIRVRWSHLVGSPTPQRAGKRSIQAF